MHQLGDKKEDSSSSRPEEGDKIQTTEVAQAVSMFSLGFSTLLLLFLL